MKIREALDSMDIICGFLTLAQQWNNANTFSSVNSREVGFKQHQDWWPVTQRDLGGEVLNLRRSSREFADGWTWGKYFLKIDAKDVVFLSGVLDVSKCFQIFRAYSKPKWSSTSCCRELIGRGGEGGGSQGEGNIHKNYSHHNHQLHANHDHHHDNHHHHRHSSTLPSSKVVPRLAGCPSVTLRGTSYQCRSFMKW